MVPFEPTLQAKCFQNKYEQMNLSTTTDLRPQFCLILYKTDRNQTDFGPYLDLVSGKHPVSFKTTQVGSCKF